jgi:tetratricopeptide (TPR) repeat protein
VRAITGLFLLSAGSLLAAESGSFEARKANVRALLGRGNFAAALAEAQAINREWPDDIAAYQLVADAQLGLGNYREAEAAIQWMLDLRVGKADAEGWRLVARFREITGDVEGALEAVNLAYGRLAEGQQDLAAVLLADAGRLQHQAGRLELAERASQEALKTAPGDTAAWKTLALVRMAQGKREEALRILGDLAKADSRYRYLLAEAGEAAGFAVDSAAAPGEDSREAVLYLAGPAKRPAEALEMARREAARRHDVFTLDALAVALFASGQPAEARSAMEKALAVGTRDPEIRAHAARIGVTTQ